MDINKTLDAIRQRPHFAENVGMMLVHNGVVRGWSRDGHKAVAAVTVTPDREKMAQICREMEARPGIFAVEAEANAGLLKPGDDVLLLVVAGDVREHVTATLVELLDRVKKEAVHKEEHFA